MTNVEVETTVLFRLPETDQLAVQELIDYLSDYSGGTIVGIDAYSYGFEFKIAG